MNKNKFITFGSGGRWSILVISINHLKLTRMRKTYSLILAGLFMATLVFTASNQAPKEKPTVVASLQADEISTSLDYSTPFHLAATDPVYLVVFTQAPGSAVNCSDILSEEVPVTLADVQVPPGSLRLKDPYQLTSKPPLNNYDVILPDSISLDPGRTLYAEWKPWGKVNTKYYSLWLFEPVKIC